MGGEDGLVAFEDPPLREVDKRISKGQDAMGVGLVHVSQALPRGRGGFGGNFYAQPPHRLPLHVSPAVELR